MYCRALACYLGLLTLLILPWNLQANTDHLAALRTQVLYAPDDGAADGDHFGSAVGIYDDWAVVGAPGDDSARKEDEGSAYILKWTNGTWAVQQKLYPHRPSDTYTANGPILFGQSVAIFEDWIAVGAPTYTNAYGGAGRVRLYQREGLTWTLKATLVQPSVSGSRTFGSGLAFAKNVLLVGAPDTGSVTTQGMVFVYRLSNHPSVGWEQTQSMSGPSVANTGFGRSLVVHQNVAFVGLPGGAGGAGEVRAYDLNTGGSTLPLLRTLANPAPTEIQRFGGSLAAANFRLLAGGRGFNAPNPLSACVFDTHGNMPLVSKVYAPETFGPPISDCPVALNGTFGILGCSGIFFGQHGMHLASFGVGGSEAQITATVAESDPLMLDGSGNYPQLLATSPTSNLSIGGSPGHKLDALTAGAVIPMNTQGRQSQPQGQVAPVLTRLRTHDDFGEVLAADGDTLLATDLGWMNKGTVHVFTRKDGVWDHSHSLDSPLQFRDGPVFYGSILSVRGKWMAIGSQRRIWVYPFQSGKWSTTPFLIDRIDTVPINEIRGMDISGDKLAITCLSDSKWTGALFRLKPEGPELVSSLTETTMGNAWGGISLSGDRAVVGVTNTTTGPQPAVIYDTKPAKWKKLSTLAPVKSVFNALYSRGMVWGGSGILMGTSNSATNPTYFSPLGAGWKASQPFTVNGSMGSVIALDARENLALLVYRQQARLFSQATGTWTNLSSFEQSQYQVYGDRKAGALNGDSAMYGLAQGSSYYGRVYVQLLAGMEVYDGPIVESGRLIPRDGTLSLGNVQVNGDTALPLTLKNSGSSTWSFDRIEVSSPVLSVPALAQIKPVPPGGTITLPALLGPTTTGIQTLTVKFYIAGSSLAMASISVLFNAQTDVLLPAENVVVPSKMVPVGDPLSLRFGSSVSRSLRFKWFKEGRALAAETSSILYRAKVAVADAGTYSVEITAPDGSKQLVKDIQVGVFKLLQQTLKVVTGGSLSLRVQAWGPNISYAWSVGNDSANIKGSKTAALQIYNLHPYQYYGNPLQAYAYNNGAGANVGTWYLEFPGGIEIEAPSLLNLMVGEPLQDVSVFSAASLASSVENISYSARGLPPGLTMDAPTGLISGTPAQAGVYLVTYQAKFTGGVSKPVTSKIVVGLAGRPALRAGTLAGLVWAGDPGADENFDMAEKFVPGVMQVEITTSGKASAQWTLGGRKLSATGQFITEAATGNEKCDLAFPPALGLGTLNGQIVMSAQTQEIHCHLNYKLPDGRDYVTAGGLHYRMTAAAASIKQYAGRKTVLFASAGSDLGQPGGSGFGTMTVSNTLNGTFAGTLPDGSGITFSSMVMDYGALMPFCFSQKPESFFAGEHQLELGYEGLAWWRQPAALKSRFYPRGFKAAQYISRSAAYHPPAAGMRIFPFMSNSNDLAELVLTSTAHGGELRDTFQLTTTHTAKFAAPNSRQIKLSFNAPTGLYTGSLVLDDPVPGSTTQRQKRTVSFRGMISSELGVGGGFYLVPMLPDPEAEPATAPATSPILSGSAALMPMPF